MGMEENIEKLLKDQPGETRAEKVSNLKKEAESRRGVMSLNPVLNSIDKLDAEGNLPKRVPAKPPNMEEVRERRAERDKMMGEEAHRKRLQGETGAMGRGGGGGGGMKPDTDITASKKLPKMAKGGSVSSASKRADGCAMRGKTKGRMV